MERSLPEKVINIVETLMLRHSLLERKRLRFEDAERQTTTQTFSSLGFREDPVIGLQRVFGGLCKPIQSHFRVLGWRMR